MSSNEIVVMPPNEGLSSFIDSISYRPEQSELVFVLKGREYIYPSVSITAVECFLDLVEATESYGKAFAKFKMVYEKVNELNPS